MLSAIAPEGKIRIVNNGQITPAQIVREQFQRVRPLASVLPNLRGWILDVLRVVHAIGRQDFTLQDVYERDSELRALHPNNQNIRAKIRQQLQVLREMRMITFQGRGNYRVV
jgi:type II restriction enzyme